MNPQDQKYYQKLKSISSAEPNYLSQFEMRYPALYDMYHFGDSALRNTPITRVLRTQKYVNTQFQRFCAFCMIPFQRFCVA